MALFGLGLAALGLYAASKVARASAAVDNLKYSLKEVKLSFSAGQLLARIDIYISNQSEERLVFKNFTGTLWADTTNLGNISVPLGASIAPKAITPVSISISIPLTTLATLAMQVISSGKLPETGRVKGILQISAFSLPIDEVFQFNKPKTQS